VEVLAVLAAVHLVGAERVGVGKIII